ncbi:Chloramphenicol 3-O phosphotransferase [Vibrio marisflavi CECT 7928]|uniref:Chloramphenicol 3-O phosphotransferase n=1 Tax=Vibrio marisflavi CECT 7928 TaxID=634439 RepID=A0ABN8E401_9VIBR|nr:Chloramphenicol 3-O phosphotransferase [Vibrio marisflavi CECT 7928]
MGESKCLFVKVECDVTVLEERERDRSDRINGSAREQSGRVHNDVVYDFAVDTTTMSAEACAEAIASQLQR